MSITSSELTSIGERIQHVHVVLSSVIARIAGQNIEKIIMPKNLNAWAEQVETSGTELNIATVGYQEFIGKRIIVDDTPPLQDRAQTLFIGVISKLFPTNVNMFQCSSDGSDQLTRDTIDMRKAAMIKLGWLYDPQIIPGKLYPDDLSPEDYSEHTLTLLADINGVPIAAARMGFQNGRATSVISDLDQMSTDEQVLIRKARPVIIERLLTSPHQTFCENVNRKYPGGKNIPLKLRILMGNQLTFNTVRLLSSYRIQLTLASVAMLSGFKYLFLDTDESFANKLDNLYGVTNLTDTRIKSMSRHRNIGVPSCALTGHVETTKIARVGNIAEGEANIYQRESVFRAFLYLNRAHMILGTSRFLRNLSRVQDLVRTE